MFGSSPAVHFGSNSACFSATATKLVQLDRQCFDMIRHLQGVGVDLKATLLVGLMAQPRGAHVSNAATLIGLKD